VGHAKDSGAADEPMTTPSPRWNRQLGFLRRRGVSHNGEQVTRHKI
jgi:hypothetical protein